MANTLPSLPVNKDKELDTLLEGFSLPNIASHLLRRAHFRAEDIFTKEVGKVGLTPRQKALLIIAYQHPGSNQSVLAEKLAIDRNSFTEMVSRMIKSGLLERRPARNDARAYEIFITEAGIDVLKVVLPIDRKVEEMIIDPLPPEYRPLFIKCLQMLVGVDK